MHGRDTMKPWFCWHMNKELLTIDTAFEERQLFLERDQFPVQILKNHKNLEYLLTVRNINQCQICRLLFLIQVCHDIPPRYKIWNSMPRPLRINVLTHAQNHFWQFKPSNFVSGTVDRSLMSIIQLLQPHHSFATQIYLEQCRCRAYLVFSTTAWVSQPWKTYLWLRWSAWTQSSEIMSWFSPVTLVKLKQET